MVHLHEIVICEEKFMICTLTTCDAIAELRNLDNVSTVCLCTIMCKHGEPEGAEHTALGGALGGDHFRGLVNESHRLGNVMNSRYICIGRC